MTFGVSEQVRAVWLTAHAGWRPRSLQGSVRSQDGGTPWSSGCDWGDREGETKLEISSAVKAARARPRVFIDAAATNAASESCSPTRLDASLMSLAPSRLPLKGERPTHPQTASLWNKMLGSAQNTAQRRPPSVPHSESTTVCVNNINVNKKRETYPCGRHEQKNSRYALNRSILDHKWSFIIQNTKNQLFVFCKFSFWLFFSHYYTLIFS